MFIVAKYLERFSWWLEAVAEAINEEGAVFEASRQFHKNKREPLIDRILWFNPKKLH